MSVARRCGALAAVAAIGLAALGLTACGGSGPGGSGSGGSTSPMANAPASGRPHRPTGRGGGRHAGHRRHGAHERARHREAGGAPDTVRNYHPPVDHATHTFSAVATGNAAALDRLAESVTAGGALKGLSAGRGGGAHIPSSLISRHRGATSTSAPGADASAGGFQFASVGGSPSQFVAAADQVCTAYRQAVHSTGQTATTLSSQEGELQTLVTQTTSALKQFAGLSPSRAQAAAAERYGSLVQTSVADFVKAQSRSSSTSEAVGTAQESSDMNLANTSSHDALTAQALARKLGLHVCGSQGAEWL